MPNRLVPADDFARMVTDIVSDGLTEAQRLIAFTEKYIRPAVQHDPIGAAILLYGERAPQVFEPKAPPLKLTPPQG